jgi:hypothetical protein
MKLKIGGSTYEVQEEKSALSEAVSALVLLNLTLTRSADHEYYGQLPKSVDVNGARQTSHVEAGGIYYFQAWNAFSLNFREMDISPYKVYVIGKTDIQTTELENAGRSLTVDILK